MELRQPPILIDRSRVVCDWTCPRRRFWNYEFEGKGLVPRRAPIALEDGTQVHEGIANILLGGDVRAAAFGAMTQVRAAILGDRIAEAGLTPEHYAEEQAHLVGGLILAWDRVVKPRLLAEFTVHRVEESILYRFRDLGLMVKPDLLAKRIADDTLWYWEWKTSGIMSASYFESWFYAVQLQATLKAIREALGEDLQGATIHVLNKGQQREGKQLSPFTYAYEKNGRVGYEYLPGSRRVPVWTLENFDIVRWVGQMPQDVIEAQFGETPPIFYNEMIATEFFEQRAIREKVIRQDRDYLKSEDTKPAFVTLTLRESFPQNFSACRPAFGPGCSYRNLCFIPQVAADPLASGEFTWRTPHHVLETTHVDD